ncbi:MAG: hypothetical protein M1830_001029 [Pleopsidium flavum]|nr:MAG: hypothetical protein M1830_001029 [Pleopsidium flavum]
MSTEALKKFPQDSHLAELLEVSKQSVRNRIPKVQAKGATPSQQMHMLRNGGSSHPLDHPWIAQPTPQYEGGHLDNFSITQNIIKPIKILPRLGVDVFVELRYDAWMVQTKWNRITNNKHAQMVEDRAVIAVNPLFSFFNHSCEPNAEFEMQERSTLEIRAKSSIKKGEELFVSCLHHVDQRPKAERQASMMEWLGKKCCCSRCRRES